MAARAMPLLGCAGSVRNGSALPPASAKVAAALATATVAGRLLRHRTVATAASRRDRGYEGTSSPTASSSSSAAPCEEGELLELRIESLTSHGQGLARLGPTRWVVMAYGALPGELVELRVTRNFRGRSEARLEQVLEASPDRVVPRCPVFERCSGCQYQHLHYDAQLRWKQQHVQDALSRIAGLQLPPDAVRPTVASPLQYHYRTKLTPHPQEPPPRRQRLAFRGAADGEQRTEAIGFLEEDWGAVRDSSGRRWKQVVDVAYCPIATEAINAALPAARQLAFGSPEQLLLRDTTEDAVVTDGQQIVTEVVPGFGAFSFRAGGFFQNNSSILPAFVQHVIDAAVGPGEAGGNVPDVLLDVYCGVGFFAISAAKRFRLVLGVEVDSTAVSLAQLNAKAQGVSNASFLAADASQGLLRIAQQASVAASQIAVVIDPPRQGLVVLSFIWFLLLLLLVAVVLLLKMFILSPKCI
ncbi:unnamed protein product [Polarella glacialis]|uniref:TRAM domain-containing protein n=1 Tax=Polarella glacialis TaxID=89957 RepID=A0A813L8R8_POLGL|nr:unnamed protein product [Polarella glacialis]